MNIHGVFLHLMADALGSVIVILTAIFVKYIPDTAFNWKIYIDPFLSILLSVFIMISTIPLVKESSKILMQSSRIDINLMKCRITAIDGVVGILSLHAWSLNSELNVATVCLKVTRLDHISYSGIKQKVKRLLNDMSIQLITVELELETDDSTLNTSNEDSLAKSLNLLI